jgi:hypothetical protein
VFSSRYGLNSYILLNELRLQRVKSILNRVLTAFALTVVLGYPWHSFPPLPWTIESCLYLEILHFYISKLCHCYSRCLYFIFLLKCEKLKLSYYQVEKHLSIHLKRFDYIVSTCLWRIIHRGNPLHETVPCSKYCPNNFLLVKSREKSEVLTVVKITILFLWVVTPYRFVGRNQHFGEAYFFHL